MGTLRHEGVYVTRQEKTADDIDHIMEVAGWGETPAGRKYWVIRNSWGTYWGEAGWAKLERGVNALMVESDCSWAVPTWDGLDEALDGRTSGDYKYGKQPIEVFAHEWTPLDAAEATGESPSGGATVLAAAVAAFSGGVATVLLAMRVSNRRRVREPTQLLG